MVEALARGITGLVPMAHVADVQRTVAFYKLMGLEVRGSLRNSTGDLQWVYVACERAEVMFTRADEPVIASQQAVLFYLYSLDLIALRQHFVGERRESIGDHVSRAHAEGRNLCRRSRRLLSPYRPDWLRAAPSTIRSRELKRSPVLPHHKDVGWRLRSPPSGQ